jgi:hypothetical protein
MASCNDDEFDIHQAFLFGEDRSLPADASVVGYRSLEDDSAFAFADDAPVYRSLDIAVPLSPPDSLLDAADVSESGNYFQDNNIINSTVKTNNKYETEYMQPQQVESGGFSGQNLPITHAIHKQKQKNEQTPPPAWSGSLCWPLEASHFFCCTTPTFLVQKLQNALEACGAECQFRSKKWRVGFFLI